MLHLNIGVTMLYGTGWIKHIHIVNLYNFCVNIERLALYVDTAQVIKDSNNKTHQIQANVSTPKKKVRLERA